MILINGQRLWNRLMEMAQIGGTPKGGVCRVALTSEDKAGRDLFIDWCKAAHCTIEVDQMGNIFARRAGRNNQLPPVMIGSHLDSQPTGGKFDGVLGVLAGLELIETLNENDVQTEMPIEVVSWTNEEGARFAPAMVSSGVFAGVFSLHYAYSRKDKKGVTLEQALEKIEYKGSLPVGNRPYSATLELHIEQGPILEKERKPIGIVTGVQGIRWYDLIVKGKETHAGPSPMSYRIDPVKGALPILQSLYVLADKYAPDARVTIGYLEADPGVKNTVPGTLTVSIDIRHPEEESLAKMDKELRCFVNEELGKSEVDFELRDIWYSPPISFDDNCISAVEAATHKLELPAKKMVSGAGHDAVYVSKVAPTSMIFVPCKDGLSHNELESVKQEEVEAGANVLLHAILQLANNN